MSFSNVNENEMNVRLIPTSYELPTIDVVEEENKDWQKNFEIFKNQFLGEETTASGSSIENPYEINFTNSEDGTLFASCREPIIINNKYLGYKLVCYLKEFSYKYPAIKYFGSIFFKEDLSKNPADAEIQLKNRLNSYTGSFRHFIQSISQSYLSRNPRLDLQNSTNNKDSLLNLNIETLSQQGFIVTTSVYLPGKLSKPKTTYPINTDFLISRGYTNSELILSFKNYLRVNFDSDLIDSKYDLNGKVEQSWITLIYDKSYIDVSSWSTREYTIKTYGDWAKKRILDILPLDYIP